MANIDRDITYMNSILHTKARDSFYCIYPHSNENLISLFNSISLEGKDVLSVLSSSDFLFSALASDARSVDTFDINFLTYRYFYLRKWLLEINEIDAYSVGLNILKAIVKSKKDSDDIDERESSIFWQNYLDQVKDGFYDTDVFACAKTIPLIPYRDDCEKISDILKTRKIEFEHANFVTEGIKNGKKYDAIYLSNILDYNRYRANLESVVYNLSDLLNDGGEVICTTLFGSAGLRGLEIPCFKREYEFTKLVSESTGKIKSYSYIKK